MGMAGALYGIYICIGVKIRCIFLKEVACMLLILLLLALALVIGYDIYEGIINKNVNYSVVQNISNVICGIVVFIMLLVCVGAELGIIV